MRLLTRTATERHGNISGRHRWEPQTPLTGEERLELRRRKEAIEEEALAEEQARVKKLEDEKQGTQPPPSSTSTPRSTMSSAKARVSPAVPSLTIKSPALRQAQSREFNMMAGPGNLG